MMYFILMSIQSLGALVIIVVGVPLYLTLMHNIDQFQADGTNAIIGFVAVVMMQLVHWIKEHYEYTPEVVRSKILGTIISFFGLLAFIVPSALFSVIFFIRLDDLKLTPFQMMVMLAVLFSMFCFTRDLEELARAFNRKNK